MAFSWVCVRQQASNGYFLSAQVTPFKSAICPPHASCHLIQPYLLELVQLQTCWTCNSHTDPGMQSQLRCHRHCQGARAPAHASLRLSTQVPLYNTRIQSASEVLTEARTIPAQSSTVVEPGATIAPLQPHSSSVQFIDSDRFPFSVYGKMALPGCDPDLVWDTLTSWETSADVFSNIQASSAQEIDGRLELTQKCSWTFLAFSGTFDTHLAVEQDVPGRQLIFTLIQSSFMKDFEGRWNVTVQEPSESQGGVVLQQCVVEHVLSVKPLMPVPPPFSYYTRSIFVKQVEGVLQDLYKEIVRQQALVTAASN